MDRCNNVNRERDIELQRDKYRLARRTWLLKVPLVFVYMCVWREVKIKENIGSWQI